MEHYDPAAVIARLEHLEGKHYRSRKDGGSRASQSVSEHTGVCYLSGPMTGLPSFNEPSFVEGAKLLRRAGWFVFNPTENDAEAGITLDGTDGTEDFDFHAAMARDLEQVCKSDALFVLPGWEYSTGAEIETWVAARMGIPVYSLLEGREVEPPQVVVHDFHTHELNPGEYAPNAILGQAHDSAGFGDDGPNAHDDPSWSIESAARFGYLFPVDSSARKAIPVVTGVFDYFPAALREVAKVSKFGNDKHNPGEPLHWARGKSMDQEDAIGRHLMERGQIDPENGLRQSAQLAWRALAMLQLELEEAGEAPLARGAREVK